MSDINYTWLSMFLGVFCVIFITSFVILAIYTKHIQKSRDAEKMRDAETGVGNLQYFKYHFRYTIEDAFRNKYCIAYIILDISYLRSYYGESSFEDVLKYTASVLMEYTGDKEICARITENGFALAIQTLNEEQAERRLKEILSKLNDFDRLKSNSNKLVFHSAAYRLTSTDKNCELLIFNLRKNCVRLFGTEKQIAFCDIHSMNKIQEEKKITDSLLNGIERNEFKMYLQFIVDNKTKQIVLAEALSRWKTAGRGLITPNKYIEQLEMTGLIGRHDFYIFDLVCRQLEKWSNTEFKDISISCNFTRITLSEENFIDKIKMISNSYSFDKSKLAIEITEDAIEKDRVIATKNVILCKQLGFKVYLDDLGSGYTSLSNLCDYPIDIVKVDRDILLKTDTAKGKALFGGIIALAHSLNVEVICEGVETEEHNKFVTSSECDFIQGWYYCKPLPLEECGNFINNRGN